MVVDTVATYIQQALGHECGQAFLVLGCVFCGWCASGVMIRLLSCGSDKTHEGSSKFRREVGTLATKYSVEEAAAHSGLDADEVVKCRNEALFWWCTETAASWLWGSPKQPDPEADEQPEETDEMENFCPASIDTKCSSNPGLALLEHYGVFGAQNGAWTGPLQ
jgi:hypothetical protein